MAAERKGLRPGFLYPLKMSFPFQNRGVRDVQTKDGMGAGVLVIELSAGGERQRDPEVKHGIQGQEI